MALYTEKNFNEAHNPLSNYGGNDAFVKGQIYAINNGGDLYNYSNNLKSYNQALEDAKANDNDNFFTGIGDLFVGRGADKLKADMADEYVKAYSANPYEFAGNDYNENAGKIRTEQDFGQGRAFNGGLIGSLINPITQVGKAGADLASGIGGNWDAWNKRDHLSDVGALGETALTFAPFLGAGTKALKGASGLGRSVLTGAGYGAGFGLAGGLKDMGSENFNGGELALNTLLGGAIGGGLSAAGAGLGKVWNKYSQPTPSKSTALIPYSGGTNNNPAYQQALNTLGITGENLNRDTLGTARKAATKNIAKNVGYETAEGQAQRTAVNNAYQTLLDSLNGRGAAASANYVAPSLSLGQRLRNFGSNIPNMGRDLTNTKAGQKVANILKTKTGKVGAGIGGGLLLANLMSNRGGGEQEMTDEELQELYNYVYGGGQ